MLGCSSDPYAKIVWFFRRIWKKKMQFTCLITLLKIQSIKPIANKLLPCSFLVNWNITEQQIVHVKTVVSATVPQVLRYFNEEVVCTLINAHGTVTSKSTCIQFCYFRQNIISFYIISFSVTFISPYTFLLTAISQFEKKRLLEVMSADLRFADKTQKQSSWHGQLPLFFC